MGKNGQNVWVEFLSCCLTGVGRQGKACLKNTLGTWRWDGNAKLVLEVVLVSIYTTLCFQKALQ